MLPGNYERIFNIVEKLRFIFLLLFVSTLCFSQWLNHSFLIAALFSSLFLIKRERLVRNSLLVLAAALVYLVAIISCVWSSDRSEALFVLEKQMTLLFVPVILGFSKKLTAMHVHIVLWGFMLSVVTACSWLLLHFYSCYQVLKTTVSFQEFVTMQLHHQFSQPLNLHATYLSMYVCMAFSIGIYFLFNGRVLLKFPLTLILLVLFASLALLSSRIVFMPFIFINVFVLPFFISRKFLIAYIAIVFSGFFGLFFLASNFTAFKDRFKTDTLRELNLKEDSGNRLSFQSITKTNDATRAERWKCAFELIQEKPILGYGTGDEKKRLAEKYQKYDLTNSSVNNFDAHNQYLAFMIKSGIPGVVSWLLILAIGLGKAIRSRNYFYLCFLLIVIFTALSENILESNKGVLFFSLFNSLFLFTSPLKKAPEGAQS